MSVLSPIYTDPLGTFTHDASSISPQIVIVKQPQSAIIPDHKVQLLRKIGNAQAEIGRLNKLLDEIRADVLVVE